MVAFSELPPTEVQVQGVTLWIYGAAGAVVLPSDKYPSSAHDAGEVRLRQPFNTHASASTLPWISKDRWAALRDLLVELQQGSPLQRVWYQRETGTCDVRLNGQRTAPLQGRGRGSAPHRRHRGRERAPRGGAHRQLGRQRRAVPQP